MLCCRNFLLEPFRLILRWKTKFQSYFSLDYGNIIYDQPNDQAFNNKLQGIP